VTQKEQETAIFVTNRLSPFPRKDERFPCTGLITRKIKLAPVYYIMSRDSHWDGKKAKCTLSLAEKSTSYGGL